MRLSRFARYSWIVLGYNVLVILWGALVRATGSGAGCGRHWPACNGEVLPRAESLETIIEFSHRLTSGVALLMVVALLIWAMRAYPAGHRVRTAAIASMIFMVIEALVGAGLVLAELVATNASVARAVVIAIHLINTFLLLGTLTLTAWWAAGGNPIRLRTAPLRLRWTLGAAFGGMLILGASGAITALGDTLLLSAGIRPEDSVLLATLIELRIAHPLLAFGVGALIWLAVHTAHTRVATGEGRRTGYALLGIYALQLLLGAVNVALKAPVPVQILHLLLSDLIWILLVVLAAQALVVPSAVASAPPVQQAIAHPGD